MAGETVELGPFVGGLNRLEDATVIADNQLVNCTNFNIGRGGELTVRPGLKSVKNAANPIGGNSNDLWSIIGAPVLPTGFSRLYVVRDSGGVYYNNTPENPSNSWTFAFSDAGDCAALVQYVDSVNTTVPWAWFVPRGPGASGVRQNLATGTGELISGIPRGSGAIVFHERMFVYGATTKNGPGTYRVYYSAVGNFASWPVNNFFDVGPGDGDFVSALAIQGDSLIIFKQNTTWALYFDADPFLGQLRKINNEIGCTSSAAVITFQSDLFIVSRRSVYRVVNSFFEDVGLQLNIQVLRAAADFNAFTDFVANMGTTLLVGIATGDTNRPYFYFVYHPDIQAWSEYVFDRYPTKFVTVVNAIAPYHQFATGKQSPNLYELKPYAVNDSDYGDYPNNITSITFKTKKYSWDSQSEFKRIFWWAIGYLNNNTPFTAYCSIDDQRISTTAQRSSPVNIRSVAKVFASTRFRYIQFLVGADTPNLRLTIFNVTANVAKKAKVVKDVTV